MGGIGDATGWIGLLPKLIGSSTVVYLLEREADQRRVKCKVKCTVTINGLLQCLVVHLLFWPQ